MGMRAENREGNRRFGEAAEHPSPASSDPIITPCISQALWPLWRLQRICERRRNPSRVMVLLYALRAAIFNPYPSCLSYKLCNHGPVCRQQAGPTQWACGLHALFKKESGALLQICSLPSLLFALFFILTTCVRSPASPPFSRSLTPTLLSSPWQLFPHIACHLFLCLPLGTSSLTLCWVLAIFTCWVFVGKFILNWSVQQTLQLYTDIPPKLHGPSVGSNLMIKKCLNEKKKSWPFKSAWYTAHNSTRRRQGEMPWDNHIS